eukprot:Gb_32384 [translate_table: standard]
MKDSLKSIAKGFNQLEYFHILRHLNETTDKMANVGILLRLGGGTLPRKVEEKLIRALILRSGGKSRANIEPLERIRLMGSIQACLVGKVWRIQSENWHGERPTVERKKNPAMEETQDQDHSSGRDICPLILWSRDIQVSLNNTFSSLSNRLDSIFIKMELVLKQMEKQLETISNICENLKKEFIDNNKQVPLDLNLYSGRHCEPMEINGAEAWESQAVDVYRGESNPNFQ